MISITRGSDLPRTREATPPSDQQLLGRWGQIGAGGGTFLYGGAGGPAAVATTWMLLPPTAEVRWDFSRRPSRGC